MSSEIEEVETTRKRGRPKGSFRVKKNVDKYNDSDSDDGKDKYSKNLNNQSYLLSRRSRRNKLVDPNKEIIVIWPDEDPIVRLGVLPHEVPEFIVSMEEQNEVDEDEEDNTTNTNIISKNNISNNDHHQKPSRSSSSSTTSSSTSLPNGIDIYCPGSTSFITQEESKIDIEANKPRIHKKKTKLTSEEIIKQNKIKESLKIDTTKSFIKGTIGEEIISSYYADYEIDSDDEIFISNLSKPNNKYNNRNNNNSKLLSLNNDNLISLSCFEKMISILEREMEVSKKFLPSRINTEELRLKSSNSLHATHSIINNIKDYLNSGDITKLMEEFIPNNSNEAIHKTNVEEITILAGMYHKTVQQLSTIMNAVEIPVNKLNSKEILGVYRAEESVVQSALNYYNCLNQINNHNKNKSRNDDEVKQTRDWETYYGTTRKSLETDKVLFPYYSVNKLRLLVSEKRAQEILVGLLRFDFESKIKGDKDNRNITNLSNLEIPNNSVDIDIELTEKEIYIIDSVYDYWLVKRSQRRISLLRCFHNFVMSNWCHQPYVMPPLFDDNNTENLALAHTKLIKLRKDLDRGRLIVDRVRRREKVKKELINITNTHMEAMIDEKLTLLTSRMIFEESGMRKRSNSIHDNTYNNACENNIDDDFSYVAHNNDLDDSYYEDSTYLANNRIIPLSNSKIDDKINNRVNIDDYTTSKRSISNVSCNDVKIDKNLVVKSNNSAWNEDEDKLLILGVSTCGVGRWIDIRQDFMLNRNSAQMNQRFARLAKLREMHLLAVSSNTKNKSTSIVPISTHSSCGHVSSKTIIDDQMIRSQLCAEALDLLISYNPEKVWESVALRYLFDTQYNEYRSGRPMKYPLSIPIPKHLSNDGYIKRINQLAPRIDNNKNNRKVKKEKKENYKKNKDINIGNNSDNSMTEEDKSKIFFLDDKDSVLKADVKRKDQLEAREMRSLLRSHTIDESIPFTASTISLLSNIPNHNTTSKKIRVNDDVFISQQIFSNQNELAFSRRAAFEKSKNIISKQEELNAKKKR